MHKCRKNEQEQAGSVGGWEGVLDEQRRVGGWVGWVDGWVGGWVGGRGDVPRAGKVDSEGAAIELGIVHAGDGGLGLVLLFVYHEAKTTVCGEVGGWVGGWLRTRRFERSTVS